jgi:hypothetical protein
MLLPSMMCGSFMHSGDCYIKYTLELILVHPTKVNKNQVYKIFLNILEPPRSPLGPIGLTIDTNSKCCTCLFDYGFTSVTLNCDKNLVLNGDIIQLKVKINNIIGTEKNLKLDSTIAIKKSNDFI